MQYWSSFLEIPSWLQNNNCQDEKQYQQLDKDCHLNKWNITFILIISYFAHRIRHLPTIANFPILSFLRLAARSLKILTLTHIDKKLHLMFFIFLWDKKCSKTKFRSNLSYLHMFWQLLLSLQLTEILIILIFIFRIWDLYHIFVEKTHKLRLLHWFLYLFQILPCKIV